MSLMSIPLWARRPWQLMLAGVVALCSLTLTGVLLTQPIDNVRFSAWQLLFLVVHGSELLVFLNTIRRETIPRRRVAWWCVAISVICGLGDFVIWNLQIKTAVFDIGIFVFLILGLAIYFPKKMWTIGNTWIIICDSLVIAFSSIAVLQSAIYLYFGHTAISEVAASASVWVCFEFVSLLGTILLFYRYRHPVLIFAVLASLCLVFGDSISVLKRWLPGTYSISGLPQWPLYFLQALNMICFAYYSVERLPEIDSDSLDRYRSNLVEWVYWNGLPVVVFLLSLVIAIFVQAPNAWPIGAALAAFFARSLVSTTEGYHLFDRVLGYSTQLTAANAALADTNARLLAAQRELQDALTQVEALTISNERHRMAREIHDGLGAHLHAAITLASALTDDEASDPTTRKILARAVTEIEQARSEMRQAITALRANAELSLEEMLAGPVYDARTYRVRMELRVEGTPRPVPVAVRHALYRVAQEAVTNIGKYAQASEAGVTIDYTDPGALVVVIADNGVGMQAPAAPRQAGSGNGLANMRARVEALGGQFELPPAERGVTLWMRLPMA